MKRQFLLLALLISLLAQPVFAKTILYVPIDNRPVNYDYVVDTAKAAGAEIITPPESLLANRTYCGNADQLWSWTFENAPVADAIVLSTDSMLYGGLVASRTHNFSSAVLEKRLANFEKLRQLNPSASLYVFSTIMRTPKASSGGTEPDYYEKYGPTIFQITALQDKKELGLLKKAEERQLSDLTASVPASSLKDWFDRRTINHNINVELINYSKKDLFDYLIQGRDDTAPYSQSHKEARMLAKKAEGVSATKYMALPGADQLGMLLITRAINNFNYDLPFLSLLYTPGKGGATVASYEDRPVAETVKAQIISAGGVLRPSLKQPDLLLAINTPENGITLEANSAANVKTPTPAVTSFATSVENSLANNTQVSVASIAFANGADNALLPELSRRGLLPKLAAFSGWNTAGNTIGYAIGQGMLANKMEAQDKNRLIAVRLIDDWAYQANIRNEVTTKVLWPLGGNYSYLNSLAPRIAQETTTRLQKFASVNFNGIETANFTASFPWNRMFEIKVNFPSIQQ